MRRILLGSLGLVLGLLTPATSVAAKSDWIKGRVELVGTVNTPSLNLVSEEGRRFEVTGDLVGELSALQGAPVLEVQVAREREGMLPRVKVVGYRILDVGGGDKPEVGIVEVKDGRVTLVVDEKTRHQLMDTQVARKLVSRVGEKVWIVGKTTSSGFKVWRVGFIAGKPAAGAASSQPASAPVEESQQ